MIQKAGPKIWQCGSRSVELGSSPCIMGILNVTPDSFSDGNRFFDIGVAVDRALEMQEEGADIIDIGGESTRPGSDLVTAAEELRRVMPVIERLSGLLRVPISIDTYKASVAREAVAAGAEIINDISAFTFDPEMAGVVAASGVGAVLMHTRGRPQEMQRNTGYDDIVQEVISFLDDSLKKAEAFGISRDRMAIDPGIGFGKDVCGNLELIRRLDELSVFGCPLLVGPSRKSMIGTILGRDVDDRLFGTAAVVAASILHGADIVRVHDVRAMRDVVEISLAIRDGFDPKLPS
jgi:dihydropteroate synthase